jgi:hypothetical protein
LAAYYPPTTWGGEASFAGWLVGWLLRRGNKERRTPRLPVRRKDRKGPLLAKLKRKGAFLITPPTSLRRGEARREGLLCYDGVLFGLEGNV